jgi:hypothetical protein
MAGLPSKRLYRSTSLLPINSVSTTVETSADVLTSTEKVPHCLSGQLSYGKPDSGS